MGNQHMQLNMDFYQFCSNYGFSLHLGIKYLNILIHYKLYGFSKDGELAARLFLICLSKKKSICIFLGLLSNIKKRI